MVQQNEAGNRHCTSLQTLCSAVRPESTFTAVRPDSTLTAVRPECKSAGHDY